MNPQDAANQTTWPVGKSRKKLNLNPALHTTEGTEITEFYELIKIDISPIRSGFHPQ